MKNRKFQNTILDLLDSKYNYLTVKIIMDEMQIHNTLATKVSIRRSINTLNSKGRVASGIVLDSDSRKWILSCWLPATPSLRTIIPVRQKTVEESIINLLRYIHAELGQDKSIGYKTLLECLKGMHIRLNYRNRNDARLAVSYHRALKELHSKQSIALIKNEDNNRIDRILFRQLLAIIIIIQQPLQLFKSIMSRIAEHPGWIR